MHNTVVDERREKQTSQQVLFMDSLRLFFFLLTRPSYGHSGHQ